MSENEITTYSPNQTETKTARDLAADVRKKGDEYRTSWVAFCKFVGSIRDKFTAAGVKSDTFYAWCLTETGFKKATVADGILYAATLPTLPAGSDQLDKSWVTTLAKARPEDRAGILATVEKMPAKKTSTERKARLQDLAQKSAAKLNPEKARNAEARKTERAKTVATESLEDALKGMPRVLKAALLAGQGYAVLMASVEFGQQHGESALLAVEKVYAERPKNEKVSKPKTEQKVPVAA